VIVQQINLYQDRFKEKRLWISATQLATVLVILVAAGAIWSFLLSDRLDKANQRYLAVKADQVRMTVELASASAELAQLLEDTRLDEDIEDTSRQISARKKVLTFVDANRFGSGQGFSNYLVALSNLQVKDVWLSRIRLAENFMAIKGSSLSAEKVPGYFDRFSEETVFKGNRFDLFEVSRAQDTEWKVDFEIATRVNADE